MTRNTASTLTSASDLKWVGPYEFNVKDYGATGDGTTDETTTFQATISAMNVSSAPRTTLRIPSGTYVLSSKLAWTLASQTNGLSIVGDGRGSTILKWTNSDGGIQITMVYPQQEGINNQSPIVVSGVTFVTTYASGGTGLEVIGATSSRQADGVTLQDCTFHTWLVNGTPTYGYWTNGAAFDSNLYQQIRNCQFYAPAGLGSGIVIKYNSAPTVIPSPMLISDTVLEGYNKAIDLGSPTQYSIQGVNIDNCFIISPRGIYCGQTTGSNVGDGLQISNTYFNCASGALYMRNFARIQMVGCFVDGASSVYVDIDSSQAVHLASNTFNAGDRVTQGTGISIANTHGIQINNNVFHNFTTDLAIGTGVKNFIFESNIFESTNDTLKAPVITGTASNSKIENWNTCQDVVSATWDPASLTTGQQDFLNIVATGAAFGQSWVVAPPYSLQNMMTSVAVLSADMVRVNIYNSSGSTVNLGSGTWTVTRVG